MTKASEELLRRTEHHNEMLEWELANYERATEVGSLESAERALGRAADHFAWLGALRHNEVEPE